MHLPYARQEISDADVAAVAAALGHRHLTQGPGVAAFEDRLARQVGARFAVAFNSGTAALHAAYAAAGLGPGDAIVTSPITFVATANAARYLGADVRFADVNPATALLDPDAADDAADDRVRAVVPVHLTGEVADLAALEAVAEARGWTVIEDAAHALGARYRTADGVWHPVGACHHSDLCCFSFHAVKHVTTGEGGAVTTNDERLADRLRRFRTHGITRDPREMVANDGPWYYEQVELGFNYRITDFQCALGASQLDRLDDFLARRRRAVGWYDERLTEVPDAVPLGRPAWSEGAHHLYVCQVPAAARRAAYDALTAQGIGVNVHYIPVYRQPYYRGLLGQELRLPGAEAYYAAALTLPLFPALTEADVSRVVDALAGVLSTVGHRP
jgi:perosamine synthetase